MAAHCVADVGAELGECPVWNTDDGRLYWIDIEGRALHAFDPESGEDEQHDLPARPGSFAFTATPGRLLVALEHQLAWYDWAARSLTPWLDVEKAGTGNRLNDGRCDPAGRFWVGSMYADVAEGQFTGMLHRVDPDGAIRTVRRGVGVSNGLAFAPDGSRMYYADTLHDTVWQYDYDLDTGEASNERVFLDFTQLPGRPDGACTDADGYYWVACVFGWAVLRAAPDGTIDRVIEVPVEKPTMPAFGGPDLDMLYVTSISATGGSRPSSVPQAHAGGVFAIEAGCRGVEEPRFAI